MRQVNKILFYHPKREDLSYIFYSLEVRGEATNRELINYFASRQFVVDAIYTISTNKLRLYSSRVSRKECLCNLVEYGFINKSEIDKFMEAR